MAQTLFGHSICKYEQISNWERRPLRKSQTHYAALDAYVLLEALDKLVEKAKKENLTPIEHFIESIDDDYFEEKERKEAEKAQKKRNTPKKPPQSAKSGNRQNQKEEAKPEQQWQAKT